LLRNTTNQCIHMRVAEGQMILRSVTPFMSQLSARFRANSSARAGR